MPQISLHNMRFGIIPVLALSHIKQLGISLIAFDLPT